MKSKLRHCFICNNCRTNCDSAHQCTHDLESGDLFPRKQFVECLGEFCDDPCPLKKETDLKPEQLVNLVVFLMEELNKHLITDSHD